MRDKVTIDVDGENIVLTRAQVNQALMTLNAPELMKFQPGDFVRLRDNPHTVGFVAPDDLAGDGCVLVAFANAIVPIHVRFLEPADGTLLLRVYEAQKRRRREHA